MSNKTLRTLIASAALALAMASASAQVVPPSQIQSTVDGVNWTGDHTVTGTQLNTIFNQIVQTFTTWGAPAASPTFTETLTAAAATITGQLINPALPGLSTNVEGTGLPGLDNSQWFVFQNVISPPTGQLYSLRVQRNSNYSGGSGTFGAIWSACNPSGAGESDFLYCDLTTMDNSATGGAYVAKYSQAFKESAAGATWAHVIELRDLSANSVTSSVADETDLFAANASDSHGNRIGNDMVCGLIPGTSGYTPLCTDMIRLGAQNGTASNGAIARGLSFQPATWTTLIGSEGSVSAVSGIDLHGIAFSGPAIALAVAQTIGVDCTGSGCTRSWNYQSGEETYHTPSGDVFQISDAGAIVAAGNLSIAGGSAITSSGPGGTLGNPAFVASSVTKTCGPTIVVTNGVVTSC